MNSFIRSILALTLFLVLFGSFNFIARGEDNTNVLAPGGGTAGGGSSVSGSGGGTGTGVVSGSGGGSGGVSGSGGGSLGGTPSGMSISLINPLGDITIQQFFLKIIQIVILFAIPIIVFFIILAGFKYVTAQGNVEQVKSATTALTWALIGGVLILGAEAILKIIQGTVASLQ